MQDVNRIDVICENLRQLWYQFPYQRFGQLISNYIMTDKDIFFQEDDTTIENIMNILERLE